MILPLQSPFFVQRSVFFLKLPNTFGALSLMFLARMLLESSRSISAREQGAASSEKATWYKSGGWGGLAAVMYGKRAMLRRRAVK